MPNIQEFSFQLAGSTIFSRVDLVKAFHQIPVHPDYVPKTAIITPFGLFEYVRMPFVLMNAAQTFQRFIDEVVRGLPFCFAYIDDLLIGSVARTKPLTDSTFTKSSSACKTTACRSTWTNQSSVLLPSPFLATLLLQKASLHSTQGLKPSNSSRSRLPSAYSRNSWVW